MIRIYLLGGLIIVMVMLVWVLPWLKKVSPEQIKVWLKKILTGLGLLLLVALVLSGRLNWLFALLGVVFATGLRLAPVLLRYMPHLHKLWTFFKSAKKQQKSDSENFRSAAITQQEALDILGLKAGASAADIIAAHRKLIARVHPDKGGSDYLAAQINLAKKVLLNS
ncbi:molecular chaperone DnaJ [Methylomonas sp. AM2-LC]|uniref:J domain-containing protein n=1 Tax=Methylomonas sp. AM2-LC TaxID=3153301 RepID=UPI0032677598